MKMWYVLQSKSKKEFFLFEQLKLHNVTTFLPCMHVKRINPRSRKVEPYFPGYLFIHTDIIETGVNTFQHMPGARGLVQFGSEYAAIEAQFIQEMKKNNQLLDSVRADEKKPVVKIKQGEHLMIKSGAFAGYEAIFDVHLTGCERARLLLKWIENKYVRVELPAENLLLR